MHNARLYFLFSWNKFQGLNSSFVLCMSVVVSAMSKASSANGVGVRVGDLVPMVGTAFIRSNSHARGVIYK